MNAPGVYLEIGPSSLKLLAGQAGLEVPLERLENGRLPPLLRERVLASVREFLKKQGVRPGTRAFCAIGARGVSLRQMTLPAAANEELEHLLLLQIEREFPLAPDELAWGYRALAADASSGNGAPKTQRLLVVAVKKELLQEYAEILSACGLTPLFTPAALARSGLAPQPPASYAVLDIGSSHSELISVEKGAPSSIRVVPWGNEKLDDESGVEALAKSLQGNPLGEKLYLTGGTDRLDGRLAPLLARAAGRSVTCELIQTTPGEGHSAAIVGLKKSCEHGGEPPLVLELKTSNGAQAVTQPAPWKWAALAGLLLLASVSLRYAEAFVQKPRLARKISEINSYRGKLPKVDRELSFLQYLKTNQPPYIESLFVMANSAPPGSRIDTLSMNRRGDFALKASMRDSQQVGEFRSKLISSGSFLTVVIDEQIPTPDKQKVNVRITGQWKALADKKSAPGELLPNQAAKLTNAVKRATASPTVNTGAPSAIAISNAVPADSAGRGSNGPGVRPIKVLQE